MSKLDVTNKTKFFYKFLVIFFSVLSIFTSQAKICYSAIYYVSTNGNDKNPGTESSPWLTLQKAADTVVAGDTVIVRAGIYNKSFTITTSGKPDKYITFQAEGAYIADTHSDSFIGTRQQPASYIRVTGFRTIKGFDVCGNFNIIENNTIEQGSVGISWHPDTSPPSTGVIVRNNVFKGKASYTSQFIVLVTGEASSNCLIEDNLFDHNTGADAMRIFGTGHIIRGNTIVGLDETGWHSDLFQVYSNNGEQSNNILVENNLYMDSTGSLGMMQNKSKILNISNWEFRNNLFVNIGQVMQIQIPYCKFYNNTFINCGHNTAGPILLRHYYSNETPQEGAYDWPHDTMIKNNIFVGCGSYPDGNNSGWYHWADNLSPSTPGMNFVADYNYVTTSKSDGFKAKTGFEGLEEHGINGGDPKFVNYDGYDFHLRADSPAVDKGIAIAGSNNDKDGNMRPAGASWDIGAYEYTNTLNNNSSLPGTPPSLRIVTSGNL